MAKNLNIPIQKEAILYLLDKWYRKVDRPLQAVHPRDLLKIIKSMCDYMGIEPHLSPELIDEACQSYFVDSKKMSEKRQNMVNL
jgi:hypothetical protein